MDIRTFWIGLVAAPFFLLPPSPVAAFQDMPYQSEPAMEQAQPPSMQAPSPDAIQQQQQLQEYNRRLQEYRKYERQRRLREQQDRARQLRERARDRTRAKTKYPDVEKSDQTPSHPESKVTDEDIDSLGEAIKAYKKSRQGDDAPQKKPAKGRVSGKAAAKMAAPAQVAAVKNEAEDAAFNTDEEIDAAAKALQEKADEALRKLREKIEAERKRLEDEQRRIKAEQERRKKDKRYRDRKDREDRLKERKEKLRQRREKLEKEADALKKRREKYEKDNKTLRKNYQEAKRDDPNCRGAYCRALRAELDRNAQEGRDLQKAETNWQRQAEAFDRDAREVRKEASDLEALKDRGYGMNKAEHRAHLAEKALDERLGSLDPKIQQVRDQRDKIKEQRGATQERLDKLQADGKGNSPEAKSLEKQLSRMDGTMEKLDRAESSLLGDRARAQDKVREAQADAVGLGDEYRKARDDYREHAKERYGAQLEVDMNEAARDKLPKNADGSPSRELTSREQDRIGRQAERMANDLADRATAQNFDFGPEASTRDTQYSKALGEVNERIDRAQGIKDASDRTLSATSTENSRAIRDLDRLEKAATKGGPVPTIRENPEAQKITGRLEAIDKEREALSTETLEKVNQAQKRETAARDELKRLGASEDPNATYTGPAANRERVEKLRQDVADAKSQADDLTRDYRAKSGSLDREAASLKEKAFPYEGTQGVAPLAEELNGILKDYGLDRNNTVDKKALAQKAEAIADPLKKFAEAESDLRQAREERGKLDKAAPEATPEAKAKTEERKEQLDTVTRTRTPLRDSASNELHKQGIETVTVAEGANKGNVYLDGDKLTPVEKAAVDLSIDGLTRPRPTAGGKPAMADTSGNKQAASPQPAEAQPAPAGEDRSAPMATPPKPSRPELAKTETGQAVAPAAPPSERLSRLDAQEKQLKSEFDDLSKQYAKAPEGSPERAAIAEKIDPYYEKFRQIDAERRQARAEAVSQPEPKAAAPTEAPAAPAAPPSERLSRLDAQEKQLKSEFDDLSKQYAKAPEGSPERAAIAEKIDPYYEKFRQIDAERRQARAEAGQPTAAQGAPDTPPTPPLSPAKAEAMKAALGDKLAEHERLTKAIEGLETSAGAMDPSLPQTQAILAQRDVLLARKHALETEVRTLANQLNLARPVRATVSAAPGPDAVPVPPAPGRDQFRDRIGQSLGERFGDSPLLAGLVLPQLVALADVAGPDSVSQAVGKLLTDPEVRDPLTLLAKLPDILLSGRGQEGLSGRALSVSRVQYLAALYQKALAMGATQAQDAAKVLRPLLDEEVEAVTDMLQDEAIEAQAEGDREREASVLADLLTVQSLGTAYDPSLEPAVTRAITVLTALRRETGASPPSTETQGELLAAATNLADALDRILGEHGEDLDAETISHIRQATSQARFLASSMATRLSSSAPRELNKPSPQAKALEDLAIESYIQGLAAMLDAGQYAAALGLADRAPGFRGSETATAFVTGELLKRLPGLTPKQQRELPSKEELLAKRFEALGNLVRRQDTPTEAAALAAELALEMASHDKSAEARTVLSDTERLLGKATPENALARATLAGARLTVEALATPEAKTLAPLVADLPEDIRSAATALALDRLGSQGNLAALDALTAALPDLKSHPGLALVATRALLEALLRQPDQASVETRLAEAVKRAEGIATSTALPEPERQALLRMAQAVTDYLAKAESIRSAIDAPKPPPQGYGGLAREALALGRWDLASQALTKGLAKARANQETEALAELAQLAELASLRARQSDVEGAAKTQAQAVIGPLLDAGIAYADKQLRLRISHLRALEQGLHFERSSGAKKERIDEMEEVRAMVTAQLRQLGLLRARLVSIRDGKSLADLRSEADAKIAAKLKDIKAEYSGIGESDKDAFQREYMAAALGELDALRAIRDGIADLMIAQSGQTRVTGVSRRPGYRRPMTRLEGELENLDLDLNGKEGARNDLLAASDTRRYFETFGGGKDEDRIRDMILAGHEVEYLESRRQQMILSYPGLTVQDRRDLYADVLRREAQRWKSEAEAVSPLLQVFGIGSFDRARAEAQLELVRSLPHQFLVSDLVREFADNRLKNPQEAFLALVRLQQMNLHAQLDLYLALLAEDDAASWYDRRLIRSNYIALTHSGVLKEFERITDEMGRLHQALIQASSRPVAKLSAADRELLEDKGFIRNGRYAVPESVTVDPVRLGEEAVKENSFIWSVDKVLTPKEVAILAATVVLPGGSAARAARAGGGFFRSVRSARALATIFGEAFAQGLSRAALARAFESGAARTLGSFLARWAGERAVEGTLFTVYSRLARAAIDPSQLLSARFYDPLGLAEEVLHNTAVIGALGLTSASLGHLEQAAAKALEHRLAQSVFRQDLFRLLAQGTTVTAEAGVLTGLSRILSGATLPQGSFAQNAAVVVLLKGFGAMQGGGESGRVGQTAETMARYNRWLDVMHIAPRGLINRFGGDWNAARAAYQRGQQIAQLEAEKTKLLDALDKAKKGKGKKAGSEETAKLQKQAEAAEARIKELAAAGETLTAAQMADLVAFRKAVVDSIAAEIVAELGGAVQAYGSNNLTSDYDISFTGPMAELAQILFAVRMRSGWGLASELGGSESARTLDTNAYTDPIFNRFKGGPDDVRFQDQFANLAARKYLPDTAWRQYRDWLLANAPEGSREAVREMLDAVEARHAAYETRVREEVAKLESESRAEAEKTGLPPELRISDGLTPERHAADLDIKARNILYEKSLARIIELVDRYKAATTEAEKAQLTQEIRNAQSEALYFAAEAYLTQAGIAHVVISIQAAKRPITIETLTGEKPQGLSIPLTPDQGRQSYVEQIGNMYKELDHGGTPAKLASKSAKYMVRALDAAFIAGVDLKPYRSFIELVLAVEANRSDVGKVNELLTAHYGPGREGRFLQDVAALERVLTARLFGGKADGWAGKAAEDFARYEALLGVNAAAPEASGASDAKAPAASATDK